MVGVQRLLGCSWSGNAINQFNWGALAGKPMLKQVGSAGAGGTEVVDFKPGNQKVWIVFMPSLRLWHDDTGNNRSLNWRLQDDNVPYTFSYRALSKASGEGNAIWFPFYSATSTMVTPGVWLKITEDVYVQGRATSLTAGKKIYVDALVLEIPIGR